MKFNAFVALLIGLVSTLSASAAAGDYKLGGETVFHLGTTVVIEDPYFLDSDGSKQYINIVSVDNTHPDIDIFCANILGLDINQITSSDLRLGTGDGMLYDRKSDSFSHVPMPNTRYNSVSSLICQSPLLPFKMLGGTVTHLPDGALRIDQVTMEYQSNPYPVVLYFLQSGDDICRHLGYSSAGAISFVYAKPDDNRTSLRINFNGPYIAISFLYLEGDPFMILDSLTCR